MTRLPRPWSLLSAVTAVIALALTAPAAAFAAEGEGAVDGSTTSTELELRSTFSMPSNTAAREQFIPMPLGLVPTRVRGTLLPDAEVNGRVVFLSHGRTIASFPVTPATEVLEVEFPVDEGDVDDNGYLVFAMRFLTDAVTDEELICVISNFGTVQFTEITVSVTGREQPPSTIAQFFSPSVREVSVIIPEDSGAAVQEAGIAAVGALAHRYPTRETEITLSTAEHADRAADAEAIGGRLIEIVPGDGEVVARVGLRDGVRLLTLTGAPELLTAAANALGSPHLTAVEADETTALSYTGHEQPRTELTLEDLGTASVGLVGIGTSIVEVAVDQTDFGLPVASVGLHLVGVRSEVPPNIVAMLSVYWNGDLVSSEVFDDNTAIDLAIDIPATRVERNNALSLRMDALPNGGGSDASSDVNCGGALGILPIEVYIDGTASTVTAVPGQGLGAGFIRFPQMLGNILPVAIGATSLLSDSLSDAALIVCALQRASSAQFSVRLISPEAFLDSSVSGLIVGASTEEIERLRAPLRMAEFRQIDSATAEFSAGVMAPYAALQAFTSGGREVLALSSWGPYQPGAVVGRQLQTSIAEYLAGDASGWYGLYADILIAQIPGDEPVFIDSRTIALQPERASDFDPTLLWVGIGVASLLVLGGLGFLARLHTRRRARRFVKAESKWQATRVPGTAPAEPVAPPADGEPR